MIVKIERDLLFQVSILPNTRPRVTNTFMALAGALVALLTKTVLVTFVTGMNLS